MPLDSGLVHHSARPWRNAMLSALAQFGGLWPHHSESNLMAGAQLSLAVRSNFAVWQKSMAQTRKDVQFAAMLAINRTAKGAATDAGEDMARRFDRPTPFTRKGMATIRATKTRMVATVFVKDLQAKYLLPNVKGGVSKPKGRVIPVPAAGRRNAYGNMPRNYLASLRGKPNVFSGEVNGKAGIFQRMRGGRIKMLVSFQPQTTYKPIWNFEAVVHRTVSATIQVHYANELRRVFKRSR